MTKLQKVLIVDASRVTRASLARYLKGHFKVCEDADGESAWQTLVLDSSIVAVISGGHLDKLDALELVEQIRENKLCRLNRMPFFMVVSESYSAQEKLAASQRGVTDFIPKHLPPADMAALLDHLLGQAHPAEERRQQALKPGSLALAQAADGAPADESARAYTGERSITGATDIMGQVGLLAGLHDVAHEGFARTGRDTVLLSPNKFAECLQQLPAASAAGVLVFGLDGYDRLLASYGVELAERVARKVSALLANKIRGEDSIGQLAPGQIAILATQTNRALCTSFASRVCKALAAAQISVRGQRVDLTVSVGVAASPEEGATPGGADLLQLARERLAAAVAAGGNRVISGDPAPDRLFGAQDAFLGRLQNVLAEASPELMASCLGQAGLQLMPLLGQLEKMFDFGLPLDEMQRRLSERAQSERTND